MCHSYLAIGTMLLAVFAAGTTAQAQRGLGDPIGVARQATRPQIVTLTGQLESINIGPCERTTGRGGVGIHLMLRTADEKTANVHLGPAAVVERFIETLKVGQTVTVEAFQTEKMRADHYVAVSLTFGDRSVKLRSESLRPVWAGGGGGWGRGGGRSQPYGRGGGGRGYGRWSMDEEEADERPGLGSADGRPLNGRGRGRGRGRGPRSVREPQQSNSVEASAPRNSKEAATPIIGP